jgi:hypothetical protein
MKADRHDTPSLICQAVPGGAAMIEEQHGIGDTSYGGGYFMAASAVSRH